MMMDTQGEQLNRVEANLDTINSEVIIIIIIMTMNDDDNDDNDNSSQMKEADKALTGMEKWCGLFVCP